MAAAIFSRDAFNSIRDTLEEAYNTKGEGDFNYFEAVADFSRDSFNILIGVHEDTSTTSGDLIDFETVLENPPFAIEWNHDFGVYRPLRKQKLHNYCDWLKIGKNERCGKRCEQFYCRTHCEYINKGGIIPLSCLCCGVGVRRSNQLCTGCEKKYGVEYK